MKITLGALPGPDGLPGLMSSVQAIADSGFSRVWIPQLPPAAEYPSWDTLITLALAGARTPGIELGTAVVVAQTQHPFVLARQALTVSAATAGRLILGIGVSHEVVIADMFGLSYDAPVAFLREYLEVLIPTLAGRPVDHHGQRITAVGQLDLIGAEAPPVMVSALGPRMLQLAGELTEGTVTTWAGLKAIEGHVVPRITRAAAEAGRQAPQVVASLPVAVTDDVDGAREQISASFSPGDLPAYRAILDVEGVDGVADICVFGSEAEVAAQLRRFADAGATEFAAMPMGDPTTVTRTIEVLAAV